MPRLTSILKDPSLLRTCLIIDALEECIEALDLLLDLVIRTSSTYSGVKWIVSNRNWPSIEKNLDITTQKVSLSLELNKESVSAAITTYIRVKVEGLAKRNKYSNDTRNAVDQLLSSLATNLSHLLLARHHRPQTQAPLLLVTFRLAIVEPQLFVIRVLQAKLSIS